MYYFSKLPITNTIINVNLSYLGKIQIIPI